MYYETMSATLSEDSDIKAIRERLVQRRRDFWADKDRPETLLDGRDYKRSNEVIKQFNVDNR